MRAEPEPERQRLLALADAVLGGLANTAPDDVPPPLRAIARFTPAKRLRLGGPQLAVSLDTDADFRARVAEAAETAQPELAQAVREGATPPQASDPLDVGVLAFLLRPDGWQQTLADAREEWSDEHAADSETDDELARLRAEVATLRAAARGEATRLRDAATAAATEAGAEAAAELAALRRSVRDRTRELRAAERERDAARDELAAGEAAAAANTAARDEQVRQLRDRVAAAERSAEAARRGVRAEREVDDARLWLLVDTLVQAASGVRRELSLAPPTLRPADQVTDAVEADPDGARAAMDTATLDGLLALPHAHLVVDGYNVTKTGYPQLTLADQRVRLVTALASLASRSGVEVTVVFDGGTRPPVQPSTPRGVRVLFSAADEIADDVIRRLVAAEPPGRPVLVVTSDRQVVADTRRAGVWSVASALLLDRLR